MFSPLTACHPAAVTAATAFLALPSSSVGALVAGSAQAQPPPPRTVAYPLWRTMTTTRRGVRRQKKKTKRRTRCSHRLPPLPPSPPPWPSLPPPRARLPWPVTPRHIPRRLGPWRTRCGGQRRREGGGLEEKRRKQKGGRGVLTACRPSRRYRRHHLPGPPFLLRGRASRGRSRPGTAPAASDRGVPAVEDNDDKKEGG